jgi:peptidoglycan/LPS O-acetylase OafA/YrhL
MSGHPVTPTAAQIASGAAPPSAAAEAERPGDDMGERRFRSDIEGLRAIAVLLVVLYHAHVPSLTGGYVGVDVFFVISGFLITGLLVREWSERRSVSLVRFYGRRARRILPAASIVVLFTMFASYRWLGFLRGNTIASDGKWAAVFLANIHFALVHLSYFASQAPPSPLQHMWSLAVEEQFYVVWPTLFLAICLVRRRSDPRLRLAVALSAVVVGSLVWSVVETTQNRTWAYFSPLPRAWELAIGGLVAVASGVIIRIPSRVAIGLGGLGLAGVIVSAFIYNDATRYPGLAVALPVLATALVIVAGSASNRGLAERLLGLGSLQWLGKRSYSLYLWHWPVLIIAAERTNKPLSLSQNLSLVLVALLASMITYRLVENPIRFSRALLSRPALAIALGLGLIAFTFAIAELEIHAHQAHRTLRNASTVIGARP